MCRLLENQKISNLNLSIKGSWVEPLINDVLGELKTVGISVKPKFWISTEWFCPDGINGIALPFYLFSKDLMSLEKKKIGYVEGGTAKSFKKYLRHELGHVIDNIYDLRNCPKRKKLFGDSAIKYPSSYKPRIYSRNFISYLEKGYGQSHPDEDFAETFAYWLDPNKRLSVKRYSSLAIKKIDYFNELFLEKKKPKKQVISNETIDHYKECDQFLSNYYRKRRKQMGIALPIKAREIICQVIEIDGNKNDLNFRLRSKVLRRNISRTFLVKEYEVEQFFKTIRINVKLSGSDKVISYKTKSQFETLVNNGFREYLDKGYNKIQM